jgi:hypothetical protein
MRSSAINDVNSAPTRTHQPGRSSKPKDSSPILFDVRSLPLAQSTSVQSVGKAQIVTHWFIPRVGEMLCERSLLPPQRRLRSAW